MARTIFLLAVFSLVYMAWISQPLSSVHIVDSIKDVFNLTMDKMIEESLTKVPLKPTTQLETIRNNYTFDEGWSDWRQEQERRKELIRKGCSVFHTSQEALLDWTNLSPGLNFKNLLVDDERRAIYCYIPKVASTNWKKVWMVLTRISNTKNLDAIPLMTPHNDTYKMQLVKGTKDLNLKKKLQTYTKLIVVRHPFQRLASAYRDKIYSGKGNPYYQKMVFEYVQRIRFKANSSDIKWPEFVDYLTKGGGRIVDPHWNSYMSLCHPCAISYDVVAKVESIQEDSERFLRLIGSPEDLHFPNSTRTSRRVDSDLWMDYENQLTKEQAFTLYKSYKRDFQLFGYVFKSND